ncbi:MAG: glycosyltransferase family 2 protein [Bacilli bacterium]|nr:glycosyltransferase family 2 protein [Bacilli bacterium]
MKRVLLIIPSYNEEENVLSNYQRILDYNKKNKTSYDAIVVSDGSVDGTEEICIKNNIPYISLIHNLGIGGAVQTGYKYAFENGYDIAIQFDGDGQHDVRYVKDIIQPILNNEANMVIGSRFIDKNSSDFKSSKVRRVGISIISFFIKVVTKKKVYDTTSGFRAIDKELIKRFSQNYPVEYPEPVSTTEILRCGYKLKEVAVSMNERENGVSSIRAWKNVYYMLNVVLSILVIGMRRIKK